jgi:hypothetical protein
MFIHCNSLPHTSTPNQPCQLYIALMTTTNVPVVRWRALVIVPPSSSASTPASVPPPAAHIPSHHPSTVSNWLNRTRCSMGLLSKRLQELTVSQRSVRQGCHTERTTTTHQAQLVGSHSLPARPVSVPVLVSTIADRMAVPMSKSAAVALGAEGVLEIADMGEAVTVQEESSS